MEVTSEGITVDNYFNQVEVTGQECRLCFVKSDQGLQIFQNLDEMPRKIMACAAVQVEEGDGLPTLICFNCRRLVDLSYEFKCQVERCDARFRQLLELKVPLNSYHTEIQHSLAQSVNRVITEAIEDEIPLAPSQTNLQLSSERPMIPGNNNSTQIISELNHENTIIFAVTDNEEVKEHSNVPVEHSSVNQISVNMSMTEQTNNVLVEKLEQFVGTHIVTEIIKNEPSTLAEESELSDEDHVYQDDVFHQQEEIKNEEIISNVIVKEDLLGSEKIQDNEDDESDEEKPLSSRTTRHKCLHCVKTFPTKSALQRHIIIHNNKTNLRYVCYMCDKQFSSINKLKNHVLSTHDSLKNENKTVIEENEASENEEKSLEKKEDTNNDPVDSTKNEKKNLKFACKYCPKQFTYEKPFLTHAKRHPEYQGQINMDEESRERGFDSEDDDMPLEGLQCTQCGKLFATKRNLKRHLSTHSGLRYNCTTCNKEFSRLDKLKEHEQTKHKDNLFGDSEDDDDDTDNENKTNDSENSKKEKHNRPHKCQMCPKAFAQAQSLKNHLVRHQRVKDTQKRFLCEVCSKCFAQSGSLVAHMRTHTGVKPYVCNVCSRAFTKSTYLQLHLRTHSGEKPYICQYCSRAFARANTLARHITMHTGEAKYHCQICMKSFRRLTSLNEHTYTHTGQRPYACKICTKRYNNAGSLYAHTKKCKAQQLSNSSGTFTVSTEDTTNQNESPSTPMLAYSQRKLSDETTSVVSQGTTNTPFIITNVQKPLNANIIQPFTVDDPSIYTVNAKPFKNPYYTIYPM